MSITETKNTKKTGLSSIKKSSSEKKKTTVRISKKDLLNLLSENERMTKQITDLQTRMNEMMEEIRNLKTAQPANEDLPNSELKDVEIEGTSSGIDYWKNIKPSFPRSDIFFDGAHGIGRQRFGSND